MALAYAETLRNARLDAIDTAVNGGDSAGLLRIYSGTRPSTGGTATTLLAQLTMSDPAFGAASSGTLTADSITGDTSADSTGTATWFRIVDSDGTFVMDGDVGASGSDLNLNTTSIVSGAAVEVTGLVITAGNA